MTCSIPTSDGERQTTIADLADLPPKPPRSKLEPHRELIRELRRKGRTYRDISRVFRERLNLSVTPSTIHSFVKVRAKHRKRTQFELPPAVADAPFPVSEQIAAFKAKPTAQATKRSPFVFRENEPLTLRSGGEQ